MKRRGWAIALGFLLMAGAAHAQTYPTRPVTMIVTAAAGGVTDVVARAVGAKLSEIWGQPVIIENKGGAGHLIGVQMVARAKPDGYTLLAAEGGAFVLNPTLYSREKLGYGPNELTPISGLVRVPQAIVAKNDLPASNIKELIALARQKPGQLTYGTAAIASAPHMNMLKFSNLTGVKLQAVHYRGAAPALNDVMAGHIDLMSISISLAAPPAQAHRLKILGIGSLKRMTQLPDMPTVAESVPGYDGLTWFGLAATGGTPPDIIRKIDADLQRVVSDPAFQKRFMVPQMFDSMVTSPEQFQQYVDTETKNWAKIIHDEHLVIE